ncbi:MAG: protein translocase subunit SecD [Gemmatimonadetes bacterium]|nr:protein translocase subunit SecD [Gemmatimonadota bacterium]NIQ55369.1 protein translocase subunit SecD [Gemmatimonadota bacterium]NIU75574.1 protein translocase subunit SecD [Gammaproteobacteria bacterium]NIX45272.1 protein translocase subunit SecD [Gemmatimonadota bacterium]NIY09555.1 protein translocase subunit SecD [Gemmatimonadota bacterium]
MFGSLRGRIVVILLVLAGSGWYLYNNGLKLGLDLQGGMHLVLEVEDPEGTMTPESRADATDRALKIIRTRIDEFGVEEPLIQKAGADRIIVELAGIQDEERAKDILRQTAFLQFFLVQSGQEYQSFRGALPRLDRAVLAAFGDELETQEPEPAAGGSETVEQLLFGDTTRADTASVAADTAAMDTTGTDTAAVPTQPSRRPLSALLMESGRDGQLLVDERDYAMVSRWLADPQVRRAIPRGITLRWGQEPEAPQGTDFYRPLWVLEDRPFLRGEELEDAQPGKEQQFNETIVSFDLSRRGGRIFERVTSQNIGELIAIVLDDQVVSAPVIQSRIGSQGQIQMGQAPLEEARDLALVLRAGALPAPLRIMEERTVGPSLGADSIDKGELAGMVGLVLVVLVMIGYYRVSGALAVGALVVYVVIVLGGLAAFGATLTLPGIAGLILSVGMAVDANVLIFERIREELAAGRVPRTAADEGFQHAMSAIVDSNLTTLLTALILFQFGTGPVRGFAVTLSIGIVASFFSAVYVTRTFFLLYLQRKSATDPISI